MFYDQRVGTNKRYAAHFDRRRYNREAEAQALIPRSLTEAERGAETQTGPPVPVSAWVPIGDVSVHVLGSAVEWTDRAVRIMWSGGDDVMREAWVWASAVERVEP